MSFRKSDPEKWAQFVEINKDPYGAGVVRFAERWAVEMERRQRRVGVPSLPSRKRPSP